jgi:hypothetical protein
MSKANLPAFFEAPRTSNALRKDKLVVWVLAQQFPPLGYTSMT